MTKELSTRLRDASLEYVDGKIRVSQALQDQIAGTTTPVLTPATFFARGGSGAQGPKTPTQALDIMDANDLRARNALRGQSVNIMAFGAVGDDSHDDTTAIQDAYAACPEFGEVIWPAPQPGKNWVLNDTLTITRSVATRGVNPQVLVKQYAAVPTFVYDGATPLVSAPLRDLRISGGTDGVVVQGQGMYQHSAFARVQVDGHTGAGFRFLAAVISAQFVDLDVIGGEHGFFIYGDQIANACSWKRIRASFTSIAGFYCDNIVRYATTGGGHTAGDPTGSQSSMSVQSLDDCVLEDNYGSAMVIKGSQIDANNLYLEQNGLTAGLPDIVLDTSWDGATGFPTQLRMNGCWAAGQSSQQISAGAVRIFCQNSFAQIYLNRCRFAGGGNIDVNHTNAVIEHSGSQPLTIINNGGGNTNGLVLGTLTLADRLITTGAGSPEGVVTAPVGSIYLQNNISEPIWRKATGSGNTGWQRGDFFPTGLYPAGNPGPVWSSAAGSPEGQVPAPVGSLYTRTNGGAGTTLYVKETGTGTTGWVAK